MTKRKSSGEGWSYLLDQGEIGTQTLTKKLKAGEVECKAVADRLGLVGVHSLSAEMTLSRAPGNKAVIYVQGVLKASVTQSCVATRAPVKEYIEEEFEAWYADPASFVSIAKARHDRQGKGKEGDAEIPILEEREDPEPMVNGKIDLGDLISQYLSLGLNPYPRAHGAGDEAKGDTVEIATAPSPIRKNPFDALKNWKAGGENKG